MLITSQIFDKMYKIFLTQELSKFENKVVSLYMQKNYQLNVKSFLNFVDEKIELDSFSIELLKQKLQQFGEQFNVQGQFDEQKLRLLLKLVTVIQSKGSEVRDMSFNEIDNEETQINFKSKKSKNSKNIPIKQMDSSPTSQQIRSNESIQLKTNKIETEDVKQQQINPNKVEQIKSKKLSEKVNQLSSIEQVDNSTEINLSNTGQDKGPFFLDMTESRDLLNKAKITQYEKFSADYVNPVIKYTVVYNNHKVLRRFSEFQKLVNILRQNYEGFILPKLPPKQGIKGGINYFWGIDETFLDERKRKLEDMLNRLLGNIFINHDKILNRFLTEQYFQIEYNKQGYGSYIKSLTDIVFNANEIKDVGLAYYNYLREKGNVKLDHEIEEKHSRIQQIIQNFTALNTYRKRINTNFDKRRQLMHEVGVKSRNPSDSILDRLMDNIVEEIEDLNFQYQNYRDLKSQQRWIIELTRQKQGAGQKTLHDLKEQQDKLVERLEKIQKNLNLSLDEFKRLKIVQLQQISDKVISWRLKVHP